jgi:acyl-coenzyme A synthetase/AMP-(fatty) acid ligase
MGAPSGFRTTRCRRLTVEPLPRNANGKVMKRQLREAWAAGQS